MIYLTEDDVRSVLAMSDALTQVDAALQARAYGRAVDVVRERTRVPQGTLHILQGAAPDLGIIGYKAYYASASGTRSHVHLYDIEGGQPIAMIEAGLFNVIRTGAASGVATRYLAREDASVVGQIGAGRMGAGQLAATCAVRRIRRAQVYARTRDKLAEFCSSMSAQLGIEVVPVESAALAVQGADVVNVITKSATPVLLGEWLEPGQHVNAAGSNALTRREVDAHAALRCDLIVVDSRNTACKECGDLLPLVESGRIQWDALPEIGEVAAGLRAGRTGPGDITLYESHGLAIQDLYVAAKILQLAQKCKIGKAF